MTSIMKKEYIKPSLVVYEIKQSRLMAGSSTRTMRVFDNDGEEIIEETKSIL